MFSPKKILKPKFKLALSLVFFLAFGFAAPTHAQDSAVKKLQDAGYIFLQVKIPSPACINGTGNENVLCCDDSMIQQYVAEKNQNLDPKVQITCPKGSIAAVKNVPAFINQFFMFGIIFLTILVTGLLVVAGLMYVTSGGNKNRASKAMDYMRNAAYSLVVLIFSTVILNQIGPRFTKLGISEVGEINQKQICSEMKDEKSCKEKSCFWESLSETCESAGEVQCSNLNSQEKCATAAGKCSWQNNICITIRTSNTTCTMAADEGACQKSVGCVWDSSCYPIDKTNQTAVTQCEPLSTQSTCSQNPLCKWMLAGCINEASARSRDCSQYNYDNCPPVACYRNAARQCAQAKKPGETCDTSVANACGSLNYCNSDSKTCQAKIGGGGACTNNSQCQSGDCIGLVGKAQGIGDYNTCTNP